MAKPRVASLVRRRSSRRHSPPAAVRVPVMVAADYVPFAVDPRRLRRAVRTVLEGEKMRCARGVSIAIVDGATMRRLNRQFLRHDYDTDVLTFCLDDEHPPEECHAECRHGPAAEIVVSADFARKMAPRFSWRPADELLLYVIHGALHLAGYDDTQADARAQMRAREAYYLGRFGLQHNHGEEVSAPPRGSRRRVKT